ncbi:hypothetical protein VSS93_33060, partial [Pseudomonas syringae pv. tagetis]
LSGVYSGVGVTGCGSAQGLLFLLLLQLLVVIARLRGVVVGLRLLRLVVVFVLGWMFVEVMCVLTLWCQLLNLRGAV